MHFVISVFDIFTVKNSQHQNNLIVVTYFLIYLKKTNDTCNFT